MPYPYNNSLGKNLPPDTDHFVTYPKKKLPAWEKKLPAWASKKPSQTEMIEALAKEHTLKFPGILPMAVTKDYPGNHPANKWGKPDYTATPDDKTDPLDAQAKKLIQDLSKGIISKQEAYDQVWGKSPPLPEQKNLAELVNAEMAAMGAKYKSKVIGEFSAAAVDPYYYAKQIGVNPYGPGDAVMHTWSNKPAPQFLGKVMDLYDHSTMSHQIRVELRIDGLGVGGIKFGLAHNIADHAAFNMNTDMLSHVLDETFAKMKKEIMNKVAEKASNQ